MPLSTDQAAEIDALRAEARETLRPTRITSYNVCYTKLLRFDGVKGRPAADGDARIDAPTLGALAQVLGADLPADLSYNFV